MSFTVFRFLRCVPFVALAGAVAAETEVITNVKPAPSPNPELSLTPAVDEVAVLETNAGPIVIEFWPDVAPKNVENFKKFANEKFYDGTAFHRIICGFMAQGGDPLTKDPAKKPMWGTGDPGYKIKAEFNTRPHERGVISMARTHDPDSAGSQSFLMFDRAPFLDGKYTAFGKMIFGEETLAKIEATPVVRAPNGELSWPESRVELKSLRIVPGSEAMSKFTTPKVGE